MTNEQTQAIRELRRIGGRRTRAVAKAAVVEAELAEAIVAADEVSVPRLTIAKEAGVVRATVYNVLKRKEQAE